MSTLSSNRCRGVLSEMKDPEETNTKVAHSKDQPFVGPDRNVGVLAEQLPDDTVHATSPQECGGQMLHMVKDEISKGTVAASNTNAAVPSLELDCVSFTEVAAGDCNSSARVRVDTARDIAAVVEGKPVKADGMSLSPKDEAKCVADPPDAHSSTMDMGCTAVTGSDTAVVDAGDVTEADVVSPLHGLIDAGSGASAAACANNSPMHKCPAAVAAAAEAATVPPEGTTTSSNLLPNLGMDSGPAETCERTLVPGNRATHTAGPAHRLGDYAGEAPAAENEAKLPLHSPSLEIDNTNITRSDHEGVNAHDVIEADVTGPLRGLFDSCGEASVSKYSLGSPNMDCIPVTGSDTAIVNAGDVAEADVPIWRLMILADDVLTLECSTPVESAAKVPQATSLPQSVLPRHARPSQNTPKRYAAEIERICSRPKRRRELSLWKKSVLHGCSNSDVRHAFAALDMATAKAEPEEFKVRTRRRRKRCVISDDSFEPEEPHSCDKQLKALQPAQIEADCELQHGEDDVQVIPHEFCVDLIDSSCDADMALALQLQEEEQEGTRRKLEPANDLTCDICLDRWSPESFFFVPCRREHSFCYNCTYKHIQTEVLTLGRRPKCPQSNSPWNGCGFTFDQPDVETVLQSAVDSIERQQEARRILDVLGTIDMPKATCVRCPSCSCWLEPPDDGRHCRCPCGASFCKLCERAPYHFRVSCEEFVRIAARYARWQREGREAYLRRAAARIAIFRSELDRYEELRARHQKQATEAERRVEEYRKAERWKARHCRQCPQCHRPIQRVAGCDSMICGVDGHGRTQHGCGHQFRWSRAPKYVPLEEKEYRPAVEEFAVERPEFYMVQWRGSSGAPLACDSCGIAVQGPRFDCVHCPSFVCCMRCESAITTRDCRAHPEAGHVFEVHLSPKDQLVPSSELSQRPERPQTASDLNTSRHTSAGMPDAKRNIE